MIQSYGDVLQNRRPDWTVVVGDVTSTIGAALAAKTVDVRVAHVEAGLRSGDRTMPEELNRLATDALADLHFTTTRNAGTHLRREGIQEERISFVGNTMVDSLLHVLPHLHRPSLFHDLALESRSYHLLTLHRPVNVDESSVLKNWIEAIVDACKGKPVIFPVHPRTLQSLRLTVDVPSTIRLVAPLPYSSFLYFQQHAGVVFTDSGGISEEATILRRPCVTLRTTTERPETITEGTNVLAPAPSDIANAVSAARAKALSARSLPELWDGRTSQRIVNALIES